MKRFGILASGLWASLVAAAPLTNRQATDIDAVVLNFALTLEHLENDFYKQGLTQFSLADFEAAGYSATYYNNLKQIAYDEQSHVELLTAALTAAGAQPVAACKYTFPYTDVASFIGFSSVVEGVGTSAYLGGAPLITSKAYLTVAGSILVTEALHTSYERAAKGEIPFPTPYGTPLDPTSVYTIAANYIHDCPANNTALPFVPFPALTYDAAGTCTCEGPDCAPSAAIKRDDWAAWSSSAPAAASTSMPPSPASTSVCTKKSGAPTGTPPPPPPPPPSPPAGMSTTCAAASTVTVTASPTWSAWSGAPTGSTGPSTNGCSPPAAGATIKFTAAKAIPAGSYVTFISGLTVVSASGTISGNDISVTIPASVAGQVYAFVTSADVETTFDTTKVLYGPAIVEVQPAPPVIDFSEI